MLIEILRSALFAKDFAEQADATVSDGLWRSPDENGDF